MPGDLPQVKEIDLTLGDGRTLHVYDTGEEDSERLAVFWHHGTPNIGAPPAPLFPAAGRLGIRWVSYDRPGYGGSSPHPARDVARRPPTCRTLPTRWAWPGSRSWSIGCLAADLRRSAAVMWARHACTRTGDLGAARGKQRRSARRDQQAVKLQGLSPAEQVDLFRSERDELAS